MRKSIMHVGLDVHKDLIEITVDGEGRRFGQVEGDLVWRFANTEEDWDRSRARIERIAWW